MGYIGWVPAPVNPPWIGLARVGLDLALEDWVWDGKDWNPDLRDWRSRHRIASRSYPGVTRGRVIRAEAG